MPTARSNVGQSAGLVSPLRGGGPIRKVSAAFCVIGLLAVGCPVGSPAQNGLPGTPLFSPLHMPLASFDRVPVKKILANPGEYHLRQIRMSGVIRSIQTDVLTQGCGRIYELTTLRLEDETGTIDIFDQGACGGNTSRLRASTLAVGDHVDVLVRVAANRDTESSRGMVEILVIWSELARK
ncbi:MAG: hypothetical protein RI101_13185 [Nitrospira sp.]|jgi:hypothetical protein|nr:hypothetical protein [Nitrospira sp.]